MTFERWFKTAKALGDFGAAIASQLCVGDAVCLSGPLGAGKSTLARGLIRALTTPHEDVPSPTFTLVQTYAAAKFHIAHFDLYRLTAPEEVYELGLDEALDEGVALIEWPERLGGALPADRLAVEILFPSADEPQGRRLRLFGEGSWKGRVPF